jgi:hypothetical protein
MVKVEEAIYMYNAGIPLSRIGNYFGVSRQRVDQVLKRYKGIVPIKRRERKLNKVAVNPSEEYVIGKLRAMGLHVDPQPYTAPFDLLVEGKRVEVKHRKVSDDNNGYPQYKFLQCSRRIELDYFVFVCGDLSDARCYIVPATNVKDSYTISVIYRNWSDKIQYLEKWQYFAEARAI